MPPAISIAWNSAQARSHKRFGQTLDIASTGGRIGDAPQMRFSHEDGLAVARDAAGKAIGQTLSIGERQDANRIGAAKARAEDRSGGAQDIGVRILGRHHPPGGFAVEPERRLRQLRRFENARP